MLILVTPLCSSLMTSIKDNYCLLHFCLLKRVGETAHLMQASLLDLTDTVDDERRDHGGCLRDIVCKHTLRKRNERGRLNCQIYGYILEGEIYFLHNRDIGCKESLTHLPDFNRSSTWVGDAWQRATITTLRVWDHPAVSALQWKFPKLDSLPTGYARLRFYDLWKTISRI